MAKLTVKNDIPTDEFTKLLVPHELGFLITIKVKPNATKEKLYLNEAGEITLSVKAVAADNAANLRVIELMSHLYSIPKSRIEIVSGATSRRKRILLKDKP
jgi:uncharacterized protein